MKLLKRTSLTATGIILLGHLLTADVRCQSGMTITSVTPESPKVGELLVINGHHLGGSNEAPAWDPRSLPSTTRNGVSDVALDQVTPRARRPGFGEGAVSGSGRRFWVPVIQHRPDRILVLIDRVTPGEYSLAIRDRDPNDFVRATESNAVRIVVQQPSPPARGAGVRDPANRPKVSRVHPALAMAGQMLDVYGDFPYPDATTDEVIVRSVGPDPVVFAGPDQTFLALRPASVTKKHLTIRLPNRGMLAGEYSITVRKRGGGPEGTAARLFVRDRPPQEWEYISALLGGTDTVPFRLVGAEANVGPNGWSVDILGYGFGPNQGGRPLYVLTRDIFEGIKANLLAGPDGALHPVPAYLEASFWSETRIRVEVPHRSGEAPTPGLRYLVINGRNREHWSNAVSVRIQ